MHGKFFGRRDPEFIFIFYRDLARHILALKRLIARQPSVGRLVGFFLVGRAVNGEEI